MATREGIHISGTYVVHHKLYDTINCMTPYIVCLFHVMYFVFKKIEGSESYF